MAQHTVQQVFDLALQHHQAGRLREAEHLYGQILNQQPAHVDALHLLGVIAHQAGRHDVAVELIRRAIAIHPEYPEALSNLGDALKDLGKFDEAIAAFEQAISLNPQIPEAHCNLGNALREKGQFDKAVAACERAINLRPEYAEAHCNLGNAFKERGQLDESIASYRRAISLKPDLAPAHSNLGNALRDRGELAEAVAACEQAIALAPGYAGARCNLGNALKDSGQLDAAIAAYRSAIALTPGYPEALNNLGVALRDKGQLDDAIAAFRQSIATRPTYPEAHNNLGSALKDTGQLDDAMVAYRQAITLRPGYSQAHSNLVYSMHYHPAQDARSIADEERRWNERHAAPLKKSIQAHANDQDPHRRLRIGYVSSDVYTHASAYFLSPLFANHDRRLVELFCYAQVVRPDAMTVQFQRQADAWRNIVGLSDEQVAQQIREDRIDILVDLKLHTAENRLLVFARKPAPVQVSWLGFPGGTGLTAIDYRLSDPHLDPPGTDESVYSERTIRLPETFWCYDPLDGRQISVGPLPAKQTGTITFGCLSNFCKINDGVLLLWSRVLRAVKNSRLILLAPEGAHRSGTLDRFCREGIEDARIEFVANQPRREYLQTYHRIDLGLDTFPYNGHTTSLDSLWMGVPVVTLIGSTPVGRAGWSQLSNLGLGELAAKTPDEFVRVAVEVASELPRLDQLRSTLRERMQQSPLMDAPRFARNIESAYRKMWDTHCLNRDPRG